MKRPTYRDVVGEVLQADGFVPNTIGKRSMEWVRRVGDFEDQVELQFSNIAGTTANFSTRDRIAEEILNASTNGDGRLDYPFRWRIGIFVHGWDRWWSNDPSGPAELARLIQDHVLPFLDQTHSFDWHFTHHGDSGKWLHSSARHYRAIYLHRLGRNAEAIELLCNPPRTLSSHLKQTALRVQTHLRKFSPST